MASSFFSTAQPGLSNLSVRRLRLGTTLDFGFFTFLYERFFIDSLQHTGTLFGTPIWPDALGLNCPLVIKKHLKVFIQRGRESVIATLFRYFATFLVSALK